MVQRNSALMVALYALASQPFSPLMAETEHSEWLCEAADTDREPSWQCERQSKQQQTQSRSIYAAPQNTRAESVGNRQENYGRLDWVPRDKLSETQKAALPSSCCGAYIEPTRTDEDANKLPEQSSLRASAKKSQLIDNVDAILSGDVLFTKGRQSVQADKVSLNKETNRATLEGDVSVRQPGVLMLADRASINIKTGEGDLEQAEFVLHESRVLGSAKRLLSNQDNVFTLEEGTYTQCEPDSDTWLLKGGEFVIDPNTEMAKARDVSLEIKGLPVFYSPYISFPIGNNRASGLLMPTVGSADDNGFDMSVPYYFNLANHYDATLTPRFMSARGTGLEAELRHLSPRFYSKLKFAFLGDDEGGNARDREQLFKEGLISEDEIRPYEGEDRWLINLEQKGRLSPQWGTLINFTQISDLDYFRDFGATSLDINSRTHLKRQLQTTYRSENWRYRLKTEDHQSLISNRPRPYRLLPQVSMNGDYQYGEVSLKLNHELTRFDHADRWTNNNDSANGDLIITGQRARLDYHLGWEKEWLWGHFKPSIMAKSLRYDLDTEGLSQDDNKSPTISAPQASLDMGLIFERQGNLFGGHTQTFEPRLFYFYSEYDDHGALFNLGEGNQYLDFDTAQLTFNYNQLFRDTRFSGGDRIDDANQLAMGLTTRFIDNTSGRERLRASLGQVYYFDDRQVTLNGVSDDLSRSAVAIQLSGQLSENWRLSGDLLYDEESESLAKAGFTARYSDDKFRLFNFNYRYTRKSPITDVSDFDNDGDFDELIDSDIEQVDISGVWPLINLDGGNVSAIVRYNYDFTYKRELETLTGLEYDSCCYRVRLVARRWLDNDLINSNPAFALDLKYDQGIFFEFELIGLGSTGERILKTLNEGIAGYEDRENQRRR